MSQDIIERIEKMGEKVLDSVEQKPIKSVIVGVLALWVIGKVVKSLKNLK